MKINNISYRTIIYMVFIFSGTIKPFFFYYNLFFDITLVSGIILIIDFIFSLSKRTISSNNFFIVLLVLTFYAWMLFSLSYTLSSSASFDKLLLFLLNLLAILYPLFFSKKIKIYFLIRAISYLSIPFSIWFIVQKKLRYSEYVYLLNIDAFDPISKTYLGFGVLSGVAAIYFFYSRKYIWFLIALLIILGLGSRGVLVFSIISIIPLFIARINNLKLRVKAIYLALVPLFFASIILLWNQIYYFSYFGLMRFTTLLNPSKDNSNSGRIDDYIFSLKHIFSSFQSFFIGEGIGSYGIIKFKSDTIFYPHNVLLEVWFELGLIGIILFISSFYISLTIKSKILIQLLFIFFMLNALKSQHLAELRLLYGFMGLTLISNKNKVLYA